MRLRTELQRTRAQAAVQAVEGRKKRERQERIRNPIKVSASQNRRAGRSTNTRPSLADMRLDQQRSELLEAKRKQPLPSP